ncbi:Protoporphyrinogen IX oxidase [Fulvivirga imtechensis AK7]|uniref:Protoporphyrinogen IX oxidase n=1 Tax=Fulvivirga imtechensis AK7 TaxID=1237149 RepID=L8JJA1_9BACT|nr:CopD family protein [Fulvivirga imtechensis]ELR68303.1 Protoporphyrinogen IX oxidase [Fulvivirga imtechensis AK7]
MAFLYLKALHIIFIVTWFAGLFYIVRLFIYQTEASERSEPDRSILIKEYKRNSKRLWFGITWPSAILTFIFGIWVLLQVPSYLSQGFMHIKLTFVFFLYIYHFACHRIYNQLQQDNYKYKSQLLRIWNEVATVLLVGIVFIIVLKNALSMVWGLAGLIIFTVLLMLAIRIYKKIRESK